MDSPSAEALKELAALAQAAKGIQFQTIANLHGDDGIPERVQVGVKAGLNPELVNLKPFFDHWRNRPTRKQGTATALTLQSFNDLTLRHATPDSVIFANTDWKNPSLMAVIDYHQDGSGANPDNLKHRILYTYPLSDPWKAWLGKNGQILSQGEFAAWVEDHIADLCNASEMPKDELEKLAIFNTEIASPSTLMMLSRGLQINISAVIKDVRTLQNGATQVTFEEEHKDDKGQPLKVPGLFILNVSPFIGGKPVQFPVRLRYRGSPGKSINWFFEIWRADGYIAKRLADDIADVKAATNLPVFEGAPEA